MSVEENRRRFINALRTNPLNLVQHRTGSLYDPVTGKVCALGLGCFEFGIDMSKYTSICNIVNEGTYEGEDYVDPYDVLYTFLGVDISGLMSIWDANDSFEMTFSQIADMLEKMWFPSQ